MKFFESNKLKKNQNKIINGFVCINKCYDEIR